MSANPTSIIRTRTFAAAGTIIASLAFAGVASASEPTTTQVSGNPRCSDIDPSFTELKLDNPRQGETKFDNGKISGSIVIKGAYVDWSVTPGVDAVIVKGGPAANVYRGDDELTGGTGFHPPINSSGRPAGVSHVQFCTDNVDSPARTTAPAPGPCEAGGPETMPDGQPCHAPAAAAAPQESSAPEGGVLGEVFQGGIPATARMSAPGSCVKGSFVQLVRGKGIRRVTMFVNGKRVRTFRGARSRYAVTVNPDRYPSGVMRLKARVEFVEKSGKRAKTFRMTVLRCARAAVEAAPAFAG
jgi:hypothetical protein